MNICSLARFATFPRHPRTLCLLSALAAFCALLLARPAAAQIYGGFGRSEADSRTVLVIQADGSCVLTNETVESRQSFEQQVTLWERFANRGEGADTDEEPNALTVPEPKKPEAKPLTNAELAAKLREIYQQTPEYGENIALSVEDSPASTNSVRLIATRTFASLKDLFSQSPYSWAPSLLMIENARLELNTNHNLQFTFSPNAATARYAKSFTRNWTSSRTKFEWKLVLPGKILSSGLPHTQDNTTWISIDADQHETVDGAVKLIGSPLVITAEATGLKLAEPLESKNLAHTGSRRQGAEPELPITDAGPGFVAEPASLSLSTIHYFPEAEKYVQDRPEAFMYGMGTTGTVISAKFFAPKSRILRSVSAVRIKSAKDDQGRPIASASTDGDDEQTTYEVSSFMSEDSENKGGTTVQLHLALPAPDAKTIDEVQAEAVALTIGGWKELTLTNVQADAKKEIDLAEVLPGAKLIIKKATTKTSQKRVEATLEGPATVRQLDVSIKLGSRRGSGSNLSERQSKTVGDKTTRQITVQAYEFQTDAEAKDSPLTLLVRFPQDIKRERVQFKLTALDLL